MYLLFDVIICLPVFIVPFLFVFGFIKNNDAIVLWLSFLFASAVYFLTYSPSAAIFILLFSMLVLFFSYSLNIPFLKQKEHLKIIVGVNIYTRQIYVFDGKTVSVLISEEACKYKEGDIVKIN